MAAKQKASKEDGAVDPYLESDKDPELEKKIDAMMSMDSPQESDSSGPPELPVRKRSIAVHHDDLVEEETPEALPVESSTETPLLPDDLLAEAIEPKAVDEPDEAIEPTAVDEPVEESLPNPDPDPEPDQPLPDELGLEDVGTAHAVDEIVASEADELLAARDHEPYAAASRAAAPHKINRKQTGSSGRRWSAKRSILVALTILFISVGAVATVPASRYYVLNAAGVRSAASVTVLDETTGQPLKNAEFLIANKSGKTDSEGTIKLTDLRLGPQTLTIKKTAFAEASRPVTLGWGSNPLGEFRLKSVGNQYRINVSDFLSGKPISKVSAVSGEADARSDDKGEIVLTVPVADVDLEKIEVKISGDGLRTETISLALGAKDTQAVKMVPDRKHVFITKRSGTFDVYKVDADGKNEEKVLSGTGSERPESIALSIHPTKNIAALVSSRDNSRNKDGFALSSLTMIDLTDNTTSNVTQSERVQMVGWIDNKLAYVTITDGASAASPNRHRLVSYDLGSKTEKELVSTNYFNDILAVGDWIYYTPASFNVNGAVGLFKVNADGSNKKTIYDKEVWNLFRTSYDKLSVSMGQDWFDLDLKTDVLTRTSMAPAIQKTRVYVNNKDNLLSLWTDERDGKGVLLRYDLAAKTDTVLQTQSGIKNPVRWLTDTHVIYRVGNNQETADYIMNTEGGEPQKIRDVTDTAGIDRWYFY